MMALKRFPAVFFTFVSAFCLLALPAPSSQTDGIVPWRTLKGLSRGKRQVCVDGAYEHNGKSCCLCAAGMKLEKPCSVQPDDRQCKQCEPQTYNSDPNSKSSCEPCTSCDQPNANLEVAEPCTPARDTRCRCKKNHYCGTEPCKLCQPCKECGAEGIQVACTAINNTFCNDKIDERNQTGVIISVIVGIVILGAIIGGFFFWKEKRSRPKTNSGAGPQDQQDVEEPLRGTSCKNIQPYLPDIADVLGWKDMKNVAMRTKIPAATIESCALNHPNDSREQTLELLKIWAEKYGSNASNYLVQNLQRAGKRAIAQDVSNILNSDR
ncbi:tumor necrosis factor receptor superfamily member 6 [Mastacembelus armatus]|uniref:Tumor necrosis factor receptor superfamily member 6 n=1 Tax=Mastacembelus armatus TaxID=205130 RepID=A0A7N8YG35_9TELE|nr:tumor necrosis factor receptor superfamily member 6-like [Mastacembelus armatus]